METKDRFAKPYVKPPPHMAPKGKKGANHPPTQMVHKARTCQDEPTCSRPCLYSSKEERERNGN